MVLHSNSDAVSTTGRCIKAGDLVIVYERFDSMKHVYVNPGESYGNRYGNFKLKDWVGKPFGSRVESSGRGQTGWVYLLAPTPELWTTVLRHRTQILYVADISLICTFLELKPGCIVLESGTGSSSLTHSLARAIAPTGHVHTFEFHLPRAQAAEKEFKEHGMGDIITVKQRNIEELGFPEELHGRADGLFLDLPGPWHAVASAAQCLRPDGVFCSFSPCIEQVQRTCAALEEQGFFAVRSMECLLRHYEVRQEKLISVDDVEGLHCQQVSAKRKRQEEFQSRKRQALSPATSPAPAAMHSNIITTSTTPASPQGAAALQASLAAEGSDAMIMEASLTAAEPLNERAAGEEKVGGPEGPGNAPGRALHEAKGDANGATSADLVPLVFQAGQQGCVTQAEAHTGAGKKLNSSALPSSHRYVVAKPVNDARGHTGYLTFARRSVDE
ncbi:hypothetical protein WJX79_000295 [Trebouxia sp. C0005]